MSGDSVESLDGSAPFPQEIPTARVFPSDLSCEPEEEKVIAWMAGAMERGLTRVYAIKIAESVALGHIVFQKTDQVLQQARPLGRQGSCIHCSCVRFEREIAILLDNDPQYDWLLSAVRQRLNDALSETQAELDLEGSQSVDVACGEKLRFLDHEFHAVKDRDGLAHVHYKPIGKRPPPQPETEHRSLRLRWHWPQLRSRRRSRRPVQHEDREGGSLLSFLGDLPAWRLPRFTFGPGSWRLTQRGTRLLLVMVLCASILPPAIFLAVKLLPGNQLRLYPVRGQVFYQGKPAAGALVVFHPKESSHSGGQLASAVVSEDGSFVLGTLAARDGALDGAYVVTICITRGNRQPDGAAGELMLAWLPARYADRHTTPLTATVQPGPTEIPAFQLHE
jgi:hypothetical protein